MSSSGPPETLTLSYGNGVGAGGFWDLSTGTGVITLADVYPNWHPAETSQLNIKRSQAARAAQKAVCRWVYI